MFVATVWISFGMLLFGWFTDRLCVDCCCFEGCWLMFDGLRMLVSCTGGGVCSLWFVLCVCGLLSVGFVGVNSVVFGAYSCWYDILFIRFECFELL